MGQRIPEPPRRFLPVEKVHSPFDTLRANGVGEGPGRTGLGKAQGERGKSELFHHGTDRGSDRISAKNSLQTPRNRLQTPENPLGTPQKPPGNPDMITRNVITSCGRRSSDRGRSNSTFITSKEPLPSRGRQQGSQKTRTSKRSWRGQNTEQYENALTHKRSVPMTGVALAVCIRNATIQSASQVDHLLVVART